jgi:hypothetical protein
MSGVWQCEKSLMQTATTIGQRFVVFLCDLHAVGRFGLRLNGGLFRPPLS